MTTEYADGRIVAHAGDCLDILPTLPDCSVDAVVTDPPYGLEFMGKDWDSFDGKALWNDKPHGDDNQRPTDENGVSTGLSRWTIARPTYTAGHPFQAWCQLWAAECLRVLKPGGHLLAFGGTRTSHRLASAIEDAGFEIRDSIAWLYGSGFPKSLDVGKAIDRAAGAERTEVVGSRGLARWKEGAPGGVAMKDDGGIRQDFDKVNTLLAPATDAARTWAGWGTALKPAHEPVICARKPFNAVPFDWRLVTTVHHALAGLLWLSLTPAKRAELTSPSSHHEQPEAMCVSALVAAATATSPDASAKTGTYNSPVLASTSLSIAKSWNAILGALSDQTTTSTTSTASSTTTALKILNSLLAPITSLATMPPCRCLTPGPSSSAPSADKTSNDDWLNWLRILDAFAPVSVGEGIALSVASALAHIAASLSDDLAAASSAAPTATTRAAGSRPAHEPIVVARKPLTGTVAANVLAWGTGALNIDACRIPGKWTPWKRADGSVNVGNDGFVPGSDNSAEGTRNPEHPAGRWPANVVLDPAAAATLDRMSGESTSFGKPRQRGDNRAATQGATRGGTSGGFNLGKGELTDHGDSGGASRFFTVAQPDPDNLNARFYYTAKAPTVERPRDGGIAHPTVKPLDLMRWLVRLVTPPGGLVLDPFAGSGTTAEAALLEGFRCIAIEREADYLPLIAARMHRRLDPVKAVRGQGLDLGLFAVDDDGAA